jgi:DUF4097 and DUF4098 domain-containing protein YvlB
VVHAVNGAIRVQHVRDVDARTVNGAIELLHATRARARTVNGGIQAAFDSAEASFLSTVNGDVSVSLPVGVDVDVEAHSVGGQMALGIPLSGTIAGTRMHGVMGKGGPTLRLKTVSGRIRVQRG